MVMMFKDFFFILFGGLVWGIDWMGRGKESVGWWD